MNELTLTNTDMEDIESRGIVDRWHDNALVKIMTPPEQHGLQAKFEKLKGKVPKDQTLKRPGPGNVSLTYLPSYQAIRNANEVFTPSGWACEIKSIKSVEKRDTTKNQFTCSTECIVRVYALGTFHEDIGHGSGAMPTAEMAKEKAEKEAVSDARKRSLKNFGDYMGNSLYDKKYLSELSTQTLIPKTAPKK